MWSKKEMLISWENAGLPGSLASILQKGKTDEKCHQSYSFFTSKRAKEASECQQQWAIFFYNQILDMIADLEATRANREENISEKKIPVWHSNNLLYVESRGTWSQLMLKLDNWRLICIPLHFFLLCFAGCCNNQTTVHIELDIWVVEEELCMEFCSLLGLTPFIKIEP